MTGKPGKIGLFCQNKVIKSRSDQFNAPIQILHLHPFYKRQMSLQLNLKRHSRMLFPRISPRNDNFLQYAHIRRFDKALFRILKVSENKDLFIKCMGNHRMHAYCEILNFRKLLEFPGKLALDTNLKKIKRVRKT